MDNPLSTKYVRPGAIAYVFSDRRSLDELLDGWKTHRWRSSVVGPHGSGKSTLVDGLVRLAQERESKVCHRFTIGTKDDKALMFRELMEAIDNADPGDILILDGFEQLGRFRRWRVLRRCRKRDLGILVTAHMPVNLPLLYEPAISAVEFERLVHDLTEKHGVHLADTEILAAFWKHQPNIREALFALYDRIEALINQAPEPVRR